MRRVATITILLVVIAAACSSESGPDETAVALENIQTNTVLGQCSSDVIGLEMTYVPDGWKCRVLDGVAANFDGFTLFRDNNALSRDNYLDGLEISISTRSPEGLPCEVLVACDKTVPLDVGHKFTVEIVDVGVPIIYGRHKRVAAEVTIHTSTPLTDDDIAFITKVLNAVEET